MAEGTCPVCDVDIESIEDAGSDLVLITPCGHYANKDEVQQ